MARLNRLQLAYAKLLAYEHEAGSHVLLDEFALVDNAKELIGSVLPRNQREQAERAVEREYAASGMEL